MMFGTMAGGENPRPATRKELGPMSLNSRRPQGFSSHRGVHGKLPLVVPSRYGVMAHGGQEGWEVVSGSRRSGGMFHGDVGQG